MLEFLQPLIEWGVSAGVGTSVTVWLWHRYSREKLIVTRLKTCAHPHAQLFLAAVDSEDFRKHFVSNGPAIDASMFKDWLEAPKKGRFRLAHTPVEDLVYVAVKGNQFCGLLTGGWYPERRKAWIGYLFNHAGDWSARQYVPALVRRMIMELGRRKRPLCFFDVELDHADAMLRRYCQYLRSFPQVRIFHVDIEYDRPPDRAGAAPGKKAKLAVVDSSGKLDPAKGVDAATCVEWLEFVFFDAYGDAEDPDSEQWEQHQAELAKVLETVKSHLPNDAFIPLRQITAPPSRCGKTSK